MKQSARIFLILLLGLSVCAPPSFSEEENLRPGASIGVCEDLYAFFNHFATDTKRGVLKAFLVGRDRPPTPAEAQIHNDAVLHGLKTAEISPASPDRIAALDAAQAQDLYRAVRNHPVASNSQLRKYDPNNCVGFCFGRAMAGHLEALINKNIDPNSILKLFAVGNLKSGRTRWGYHVTLIVKAKGEEGWWAIDPLFERALPYEDWTRRMNEKYNADGNMLYFATPPKRMGPSANSIYSPASLHIPPYRNYFTDLIRTYQTRAPFPDKGPPGFLKSMWITILNNL